MDLRVAFRRAFLLLAVFAAAACDPAPGATPTGEPAATRQTSAAASPVPSPIPLPTTESLAPGATAVAFPFPADAIVGYYESQGYACSAGVPSTEAAGYLFRRCELTDADGRIRVVGIVTDTEGALADGFASIQGTSTESILDPVVALDPLSGFLGAMLGETEGEALLPWLASHLGDTYATTSVGDLTIATYTEAADDHSKLYLEVANQAYLNAPRPSSVP